MQIAFGIRVSHKKSTFCETENVDLKFDLIFDLLLFLFTLKTCLLLL